jgi:hypothetical protein
LFHRHIGIVHRAEPYCSSYPLAGQKVLQQIQCVDFNPDFRKIPNPVAFRAGIAVNTLVLTAIMGINGGGNSLSVQHKSPLIIIQLSGFNHYGITELKKHPVTGGEIK